MSVNIKLDIDTNVLESAVQSKVDQIINAETMTEIHELFASFCEPYVPMREGVLSQSPTVEPDGVTWGGRGAPYGHYMYEGQVYGPNYPIKEGGQLVGFFTNPYGKKAPIIQGGRVIGWYSPPSPKHPTGKNIQYDTSKHPKASDHWDKAMMRDVGNDFEKRVEEIIERRASEL